MQLSILIRNLNEAAALRQTLLSLKQQETGGLQYEVVIVDNESDDNSLEVAQEFGCTVISMKRSEFTFGHALNVGISHCAGEFILVMSAHIILLNEFFLKNIPGYFDDAAVAGLRFILPGGKSPEQISEGVQRLSFADSENFIQSNWKHFLVNHCAAIRKTVCDEIPFDENIFASEDKTWSLAVLKKGYSILYNVPGFYLYTKPFSRQTKLKRAILEEAAKEKITGQPSPFRHGSIFSKPLWARHYRRFISELKMNNAINSGIKKMKNNK